MLDVNVISKNLVKLRKQKGLKQQELADKIHYSDKVISKWERGESVPDVSALSALADFFGITLDAIVKEISIKQLEDVTAESGEVITSADEQFKPTGNMRCKTNQNIFFKKALIWAAVSFLFCLLIYGITAISLNSRLILQWGLLIFIAVPIVFCAVFAAHKTKNKSKENKEIL